MTTFGEERICRRCYRVFTPERPGQLKCRVCMRYYIDRPMYGRTKYESPVGAEQESPVSNRDFWTENPNAGNTDLPAFLTQEDKEYLAANMVVFNIFNIAQGRSNYGDCWWVHIEVDPDDVTIFDESDEEGFLCKRTLTFNGRGNGTSRDDVLSKMYSYFRDGGDPIEAVLAQYDTKAGNIAYGIEKPPHEDLVKADPPAEGNLSGLTEDAQTRVRAAQAKESRGRQAGARRAASR